MGRKRKPGPPKIHRKNWLKRISLIQNNNLVLDNIAKD